MDRLATKIEPQTQSKQIDEIKGSFDVQPTVPFKPNVDREFRRSNRGAYQIERGDG